MWNNIHLVGSNQNGETTGLWPLLVVRVRLHPYAHLRKEGGVIGRSGAISGGLRGVGDMWSNIHLLAQTKMARRQAYGRYV